MAYAAKVKQRGQHGAHGVGKCKAGAPKVVFFQDLAHGVFA
jgi:hypothetical protein